MNTNPLVSIMTPAFNAEDTILRAIKSLTLQTYQTWECIIVDDGSTDKTSSLVSSIVDPRIKLIRLEKNMGRGYARQVALDNCSGQFIAMLDADDWYYPNKIQRQVEAFTNNPDLTIVSCGMAISDVEGNIVGVRSLGDNIVKSFRKPTRVPLAHAPSMYKASEARKIKYDPKLKLGQDMDYMRRLLINKKYIQLDSIGYVYEEYSSNNPLKNIRSYGYSSLSYLKFIKSFPLISSQRALIEIFKIPRVIFYASLGNYDMLLEKRSKRPNELQKLEYAKIVDMLNDNEI